MSLSFTNETMLDISNRLQSVLAGGKKVCFQVINPDLGANIYAGHLIYLDGIAYRYHGYKAWTDLAERLLCRMLTPVRIDDHRVEICFEKLTLEDSFHREENSNEKYGVDSKFFQINKNEEPAFLLAYKQALESVGIATRRRILDLGVNRGDEFSLIKAMVDEASFEKMMLTGVDYSASAIAHAKKSFPEPNVLFFEHDITALKRLELEPFDLIISIGTFQSPSINFKTLLMDLVQNYLTEEGAIILGFPNCRWMGGEMIYGAKVPHYAESEMGLLYSDVVYAKKYLQQKKFRVTVRGKDYVFLTATKFGGKER